jgi:glutamate synthase (NADPH) large chain
MVPGMKFVLNGIANDYVGKNMLGGKIVVRPDAASELAKAPDMHEIAGNTLCYGAIGGEIYLAGRVRERFLVRGSGVRAVVEGCGDNGCEYMSGGVAVLLGKTGNFFGSGMKGGLAFIYDVDNTAESRVNKDDIELFSFDDRECLVKIGAYEKELKQLIVNHHFETASPKAARILADWDKEKHKFKVIVPKEVLALVEKPGSCVVRAVEAFFHGRPMSRLPVIAED